MGLLDFIFGKKNASKESVLLNRSVSARLRKHVLPRNVKYALQKIVARKPSDRHV